MRPNYTPISREFGDRPITREQKDFAFGMYDDMSSSEIPQRGVAYMANVHNLGTQVRSRCGTRQWGNYNSKTPSVTFPSIGSGTYATAIVGNKRRWTNVDLVSPLKLSAKQIGNYVTFTYGGRAYSERITTAGGSGESESYFETKVEGNASIVGQISASIVGALNGWMFSSQHRKVIALVGTEVFISTDEYMTSWTKSMFIGIGSGDYFWVYGEGNTSSRLIDQSPSNAVSQFDILNNSAYLFNPNGIYKIDISEPLMPMYKINVPAPTQNIVTSGSVPDDKQTPNQTHKYLYGRKRVYSYVRLSGSGQRDRKTDGVQILWESGGVAVTESNEDDFGVVWEYDDATYPPAPSDGYRAFPRKPTKGFSGMAGNPYSPHATHIAVYGTANIHATEGILKYSNNPELLVWEMDLPIVQAFSVILVGEIVSHPAPDAFVYNFQWKNGIAPNIPYGILNYESDVFVENSKAVARIDTVNMTITLGKAYSYFSEYTLACAIGSSTAIKMSNVGGVYSFDVFESYIGSGADYGVYLQSGMPIFFDDGTVGIVDEYLGNINQIPAVWQFTILDDEREDGTYYGAIFTPQGTSMYAVSDVSDADIMARSEVRFMQSRFMSPVPNCDLGVIMGDFAVMAPSNGKSVYHSQIWKYFEYLIGIYNVMTQEMKIINDSVMELTKFEKIVCVRGKSTTKIIPTTNYDTTGYGNKARYVMTLAHIKEVSASVGSSGVGSSCKIYNSSAEYVLTNEPALRLFDGSVYGDNLIENRISHKVNQLQNAYTLHHDPSWGLIIWGRR